MIPKQYKKAITFSYDDGNMQDIRLVALFNQYHVKCTFNLNSGLNNNIQWIYKNAQVRRLNLPDYRNLYNGHEIGIHGSHHTKLTELPQKELEHEIHSDIDTLAKIFGRVPVGMAYPYGAYGNHVIETAKKAGIRYARLAKGDRFFDFPDNLYTIVPTCHHNDENLFLLAERFLEMPVLMGKPKVFHICGRSYEFDGDRNWDRLQRLLEMIAGKDDIFYGTNAEVYLP